LKNTWISADDAIKRRILEIVCLNCRVDGVTLVPTTREPFDVLAERLVVYQVGVTAVEHFVQGIRAWKAGVRVFLSRETVKRD